MTIATSDTPGISPFMAENDIKRYDLVFKMLQAKLKVLLHDMDVKKKFLSEKFDGSDFDKVRYASLEAQLAQTISEVKQTEYEIKSTQMTKAEVEKNYKEWKAKQKPIVGVVK